MHGNETHPSTDLSVHAQQQVYTDKHNYWKGTRECDARELEFFRWSYRSTIACSSKLLNVARERRAALFSTIVT